jgi:hypothetical protein
MAENGTTSMSEGKLRGGSRLSYAVEVGDYFRNLDGDVSEWLFGAAPPEAQQGLPSSISFTPPMPW